MEGTLLRIFLKFFFIVFAVCFYPTVSLSNNLETCVSGKYPTLCKKNLLTSEQLVQVENAKILFDKNKNNVLSTQSSALGATSYLNMGGGDMMNLDTGNYIMSMGGGDMMNLGTGDYLMSMGGGDMINLNTGGLIMSFD